MKYIRHTLLLLVSVLLFVGCSSQDSDKPNSGVSGESGEKDNNLLIGGWSYREIPWSLDESNCVSTNQGVYVFEGDGTVKIGVTPVYTDLELEEKSNHLCYVYSTKYEINKDTLTIMEDEEYCECKQYYKYKLNKTETGYYCTPFATIYDGIEYNYEDIEKNPEKYDMDNLSFNTPSDFELREYDGDFESCSDEYKACEDAVLLRCCYYSAKSAFNAFTDFLADYYVKNGGYEGITVYFGEYNYDSITKELVKLSDDGNIRIKLTEGGCFTEVDWDNMSSDDIYYFGRTIEEVFFVQAKEKNRDDIINQYPNDISGSFEGLKESENVVWGEHYHKY